MYYKKVGFGTNYPLDFYEAIAEGSLIFHIKLLSLLHFPRLERRNTYCLLLIHLSIYWQIANQRAEQIYDIDRILGLNHLKLLQRMKQSMDRAEELDQNCCANENERNFPGIFLIRWNVTRYEAFFARILFVTIHTKSPHLREGTFPTRRNFQLESIFDLELGLGALSSCLQVLVPPRIFPGSKWNHFSKIVRRQLHLVSEILNELKLKLQRNKRDSMVQLNSGLHGNLKDFSSKYLPFGIKTFSIYVHW